MKRLKKYIAREPEVNVVLLQVTRMTLPWQDPSAGVIHQDTYPEIGEVPELEGYHQKQGVQAVKLGEDLHEDQRHALKDFINRYPDVFTYIPAEPDVILNASY